MAQTKEQIKIPEKALAGVAQHQPVNQRVASLIPSLVHMPGLLARSQVGGA